MERFERVISRTQSFYKLVKEKKNITQQCSYNLPIELEEYLKSISAIRRLSPDGDETHVLYTLRDNYKVKLSHNILCIIGDLYDVDNNKVVFTHTEERNGKTPKFQLKKTDFSQFGQDYKWFVDLYANNFEGINFLTLVDESNKTITFDVEFSSSMFVNNDQNEDDFSSAHFYGMHIKNKNTCLSEEYPHICLGWGAMGDLTTLTSKEDLEKKHKEAYPNNNNYSRATAVSMIYLFRFEMNINDIVVYFDGRNANIGRITSEYYYDSTYEGDTSDYGSKRNVEWIKSVQYSKLVPIFRSRTTVPKSLYRLDVFKSYILDLLNDVNYEDDNETDEYFDNDNQTLEDNVRSSFDFNCPNKEGQNLVVYGTPGCGKSYYVQHELLKDYEMVDGVFNHVIRTTFYQDYTNTDFVGQIMPRVDGDKVTYEFNPGPFTLALNMAIKNPEYPVALVIEELNRGNAASIFGDIFQLLDRENGSSVYGITNLNIQQYLEKENPQYKFDYIKLPSNFSIFATMNTSDQNVFTLDTAFKRRWKFEKLKNDFKTDHEYKDYYIPGMDMCWEDFCNTINSYMLTSDSSFNSEDKQLGVYFVDKDGLRVNREDASTPKARKEFAYKIFEYLWNDVSKFEHDHWFQDCNSLDDVIDKYINASEYENDSNNDGRIVFVKDVFNK